MKPLEPNLKPNLTSASCKFLLFVFRGVSVTGVVKLYHLHCFKPPLSWNIFQFLPAAKPAGQWIIFGLLPSVFSEIQPFRGQRGTGTWVIGVKDENLRILVWPADCLLFQNMQIWLQWCNAKLSSMKNYKLRWCQLIVYFQLIVYILQNLQILPHWCNTKLSSIKY